MTLRIGKVEIKESFKLSTTEEPTNNYELEEKLGKGAFGTVWKARDKTTGEEVAIKEVNVEAEGELEDLMVEIEHMSALQNEYIVNYKRSYLKKKDPQGYSLSICMEYCACGSICDLMEITKKVLTEEQIAVVMRDTLKGLHFLHAKKRIHRDIKSGNILLNAAGVSKLADFGVSGNVKDFTKHHTVIGTPFWMAPEVIQEEYDRKADLWSLGITCIEMAEGKPPYYSIHPMRVIFMIPTRPPPTLQEPEKWSKHFHDFVACALTKNPRDRPGAGRLLKHPFVTQAKGLSAATLFKPLYEESLAVIKTLGSREAALGLEDSSDEEEVERGAGSSSSNSGSSSGGSGNYGTMVVNMHPDEDEDDGDNYGTMVITKDSQRRKDDTPFVPQFLGLLQKKNAYAGKTVEELNQVMLDLDAQLEKDLQALAANFKDDKRIIRNVVQKRKTGK